MNKTKPEPKAEAQPKLPRNYIEVCDHPEGVMIEVYIQDKLSSWIVFDTPQRAFRLLDQIEKHVFAKFGSR
jgi:hypothetical protein